ncbi:alpha/beta hydrolase [Sporomusa aerivorans]|uniref:alpha/beta hydrolase n=1 Tax=Sporomusa aerivorans TaxID=204936 RepID=UPI00352B0D4E
MDTQLQIHKRKIYLFTGLSLVLSLLIAGNMLLLLGGIIFHNELCLFNTRTEFIYYKNLQARLKYGLEMKNWQSVQLQSRYGYALTGTFIPSSIPSNKTVIFLHGISATQNMGLHYEDMYLSNGYNLLIYDARGHGESGGPCTSWGYYEKYDLDQWVDWLLTKNPQSVIGVHGVSMGAATALMHAALNEPAKRVKFYIADSAYSDFTTLISEKIINLTHSEYPLWVYILIRYASFIAYWQSGFLYEEISPVRELAHVTTPILYLHGAADPVVPVEMSRTLYEATKGYRELYIFPNTRHGRAIIERKNEYQNTIVRFLNLINSK